ncbi:MAG: hypothetical protein AABW83_02215 [Nanoarchaeota archaeon]
MVEPFLIHPYFLDYVLPFVLVFTLIFAILQRTKLLGEEKKQVDALVGLVVGLILIAFPSARSIVVLLMPFLAVSAVLLLVFMLLYGFIMGKSDGDVLDKGWKRTFGAILALALITFFLIITGYWDSVYYYFFGSNYRQIWANIILVLAIAAAIGAVLFGEKVNSKSG